MFTLALTILAAVAAGLLTYAALIEPRWLRVRRRVLRLASWPAALDGFTLLHISDLHLRERPGLEDSFLLRAAALHADLTVITGDFLSGPKAIPRLRHALAPFYRHTVYAVPGNHEHYEYPWGIHRRASFTAKRSTETSHILAALHDAGIEVLSNRSVQVGNSGASFTLAGVDDMFARRDDLSAALRAAHLGDPLVLLCHSPDVLADAAARGILLVLSGHTHGGQVSIPGIGAPFTATRHPLPRACGILHRGATLMHISPGLGTTTLPFRFRVRPELTLLELHGPAPEVSHPSTRLEEER